MHPVVLSCKSQNLMGQTCIIQRVVTSVKNEGFLAQGKFHESSSCLRSQRCLKKRFTINDSKPKAFDGIVRHQIDPLNCTEISRSMLGFTGRLQGTSTQCQIWCQDP